MWRRPLRISQAGSPEQGIIWRRPPPNSEEGFIIVKVSKNSQKKVLKKVLNILSIFLSTQKSARKVTFVTHVISIMPEAGGHSAGADTGWSGPGRRHLQCLQPAATQSLWQETVFNSSRWKFFSPLRWVTRTPSLCARFTAWKRKASTLWGGGDRGGG